MKTFLSFIGIFLFSSVFAQDQQLIENSWYIHKLVISGEVILPPYAADFNNNSFSVSQNNNNDKLILQIGYCGYLSSQIVFEEAVFTLQDFPTSLDSSCNDEEGIAFENAHFNIYYNSQTALNPFNYTITNGTSDDKLLVITNPDGDSAHYGNFMLSNTQFKDTAFHIYPNPVVDELNIKTDVTVAVVKIYTADGREVTTESLQHQQTKINVTSLSKGIYILQLTDEQDRVYTSKFIKM